MPSRQEKIKILFYNTLQQNIQAECHSKQVCLCPIGMEIRVLVPTSLPKWQFVSRELQRVPDWQGKERTKLPKRGPVARGRRYYLHCFSKKSMRESRDQSVVEKTLSLVAALHCTNPPCLRCVFLVPCVFEPRRVQPGRLPIRVADCLAHRENWVLGQARVERLRVAGAGRAVTLPTKPGPKTIKMGIFLRH